MKQKSKRAKKKASKVAPEPEINGVDSDFPDWPATAGKGGRGKALGVRWTLTILALFAIVVLILRGFSPVQQNVVNQINTSGVSSVGEYAASFARDWFTWDGEDRQEREARLSVYNPSLSTAGWDGQGRQTVLDARPFAQRQLDDSTYRVTVRVVVDTTPAAFYVDVLAAATTGAYSVQSIPTLVPAPAYAAYTGPEDKRSSNVEPDTEITAQISEVLDNFFEAWANGERLGQFVRDPSTFTPLGGGITYNGATNVTIPAAADGDDPAIREVLVTVNWTWPGGGRAPATYDVEVHQEAGKWFVNAIKGGVHDPTIGPSAAEPATDD